VHGDVAAPEVCVAGKVVGNIEADDVVIQSGGVVLGAVQVRHLTIDTGGTLGRHPKADRE
jgi:cytoskeletal protein CcmA (bactofilin family)